MKPIHLADQIEKTIIWNKVQKKKLLPNAPTILVGIPSRGMVSVEFMMCLQQIFQPLNISMAYYVSKDPNKLPAEQRETITEYALNISARYVLFMDDDILFEPMVLYKLFIDIQTTSDAAIVSGVYGTKNDPSEPFVYKEFGRGAYWGMTLGCIEQVWAFGAGCILVDMEYVKKMKKPYWLDEYREVDGIPGMVGQDINFCRKIQEEAEGKCFVDTTIFCGHIDHKTGKIFHVPIEKLKNLNTEEHWNKVWQTEGKNTIRRYPEMYGQIISWVQPGSRVIDFGCGVGVLLGRLQAGVKDLDLTGVDISSYGIQCVEELGIKAYKCELPGGFNSDEHWNYAISTELLEHVDDDQAIVDMMCKHADTVIVAVPNNIMTPREMHEHRRTYTREDILRLFEKYNIRNEVVDLGSHLLFRFEVKHPLI